jgi:hypothetical protein
MNQPPVALKESCTAPEEPKREPINKQEAPRKSINKGNPEKAKKELRQGP